MNPLTPEHLKTIRTAICSLPEDASEEAIEQTARRLKQICYEPLLIRKPSDYLHITKEGLLAFIDELTEGPDAGDVTEQDVNLLLHQYQILQKLRQNDPDMWDEITELWEED
ncbi:MAG: hypothetical protein RRC34_07135 [Lentisphaeria bacterium]|nr:hypothetical protein [Lentisphaeria bacterium]